MRDCHINIFDCEKDDGTLRTFLIFPMAPLSVRVRERLSRKFSEPKAFGGRLLKRKATRRLFPIYRQGAWGQGGQEAALWSRGR